MTGETIAHYEVLEKLGEGGMGVVYKALDTRLRRLVALKFLPGDLVANTTRIERFEAEARAVSSLNHPHIATIHSMDEDGSRRFLVLEYLAGGTLRSRIDMHAAQGEEFPIGEAVRIAAAVADGLAHAHRNGVIHRDLKPENIMFTEDGIPRITDFGLAKSPRGAEITTEGMTVGTVPYIAPEQATSGETSARSDLFSLGVVVYETLAGARPFSGATDFSTMQAIVTDQPARLRHVRPDVPAELDRIVAKLLEKSPERRFQSAGELATELSALSLQTSIRPAIGDANATRTLTRLAIATGAIRLRSRRRPWIPVAVTGIALSAAASTWLAMKPRPPISQTIQLAVLPFTASSGAKDDVAFGDGMAEIVAARLAAMGPNVQIIPESDLRRNRVTSPAEANRVFGVRQILTGEVQRGAGGQTRVDMHLVDGRSGRTAASASATAAGPDLDDAVAREASGLIGLPFDSLDAAKARASNTKTATAYDYYVLGNGYLQRYDQAGNLDYAIAAFRNAIERDASYAMAYAGLASAWWRQAEYTHDPKALEHAQDDAMQAITRNERLGMPHVVLGAIAVRAAQIEDGIRELKKAIELEPVNADAWRELANAYVASGNIGGAEATYQKAIRYRPDFWLGYNDLGIFYNDQARYADADAAFKKAAALTPDNYIVYRNLGGVELARGEWDNAEQHLLKAIALRPRGSIYSNLGSLYIYIGRYADSVAAYEKAISMAGDERHAYAIWGNLGDAYSLMPGQRGQALDAWKKAIAAGMANLALKPDNPDVASTVAVYEAKTGQFESARQRIAECRRRAPKDPDVALRAVIVAELDHRRPDALAALRSAIENGYSQSLVEREPDLKSLRSDAGYTAIVAHPREGK